MTSWAGYVPNQFNRICTKHLKRDVTRNFLKDWLASKATIPPLDLMADDFIGHDGTLANLRGWLQKRGGWVIGAVVLAGKPHSAKLNPAEEQLHELEQKQGRSFEKWWREHFGHAFDCLAQSEARYLSRSPDADTIRDRLAAAVCEGGDGRRLRSLREGRNRLEELNHWCPEP